MNIINREEVGIKHARIYVLKNALHHIKNKSDGTFDIYIAKNGSGIKGAIEIIPTVEFILDTPNREKIRFDINSEYFEDIFKVRAPSDVKHTVIRTYLDENSSILMEDEELFKGDVYWIKRVDYRYLEKLLYNSLEDFLEQEFNMGLTSPDEPLQVRSSIKNYASMGWMNEYKLEVLTTSDLLSNMMSCNPRLFNEKLDYMLRHIPRRYFKQVFV